MLQFKTRACKGCQTKHLCTKSKKGRVIERTEYTPCIEENQRKIEQNKELYKQRQSIVEHPFGTIKRQWGFYFIISKKGLARASADVGLMVTAYNLRRLMNILGIDVLREALTTSILQFSLLLWLIRAKTIRGFALSAIVGIPVKNSKHILFSPIFGKRLPAQRRL